MPDARCDELSGVGIYDNARPSQVYDATDYSRTSELCCGEGDLSDGDDDDPAADGVPARASPSILIVLVALHRERGTSRVPLSIDLPLKHGDVPVGDFRRIVAIKRSLVCSWSVMASSARASVAPPTRSVRTTSNTP